MHCAICMYCHTISKLNFVYVYAFMYIICTEDLIRNINIKHICTINDKNNGAFCILGVSIFGINMRLCHHTWNYY